MRWWMSTSPAHRLNLTRGLRPADGAPEGVALAIHRRPPLQAGGGWRPRADAAALVAAGMARLQARWVQPVREATVRRVSGGVEFPMRPLPCCAEAGAFAQQVGGPGGRSGGLAVRLDGDQTHADR